MRHLPNHFEALIIDMAVNTISESNQASVLSRFFSSTVFGEMARRGASPTLMRLAKESSLLKQISKRKTVGNLFDAAFELLKEKNYRDEYVYKAALTHKILLGTHSLRTASMLAEFRVGKRKADLVILNGTATAYEIKSERDSLSRLQDQISSYRKVFAKVNVIAGERHVESIFSNTPDDVGVLMLSNRHRISTLREAENCPERTSPQEVFECIRLNEAKEILRLLGVAIPSLPNTAMYEAVREKFIKLDAKEAHLGMVTVLKKERCLMPLAELLDHLPESLHTAALSTPFRKVDRPKLLRAINTRLADASSWS